MNVYEPSYIETFKTGLLTRKVKKAYEILNSCNLCPRQCRVDRISGGTGVCKTGKKAMVSSYNAHFGEEGPLVGVHGSGTIFFTNCNLLCIFCQNYDISHKGHGEEVSDEELAQIMLYLQNEGCHNINFVTPSHVVPNILSAVNIAAEQGFNIPLVYNTGGYDRIETLKLLEGVVDIYMPDFKFWDKKVAELTCKAKDYPEIVCEALIEMHRQVGELVTDPTGIARRGVLVRHLVLPRSLAGTRQVMKFIANKISKNTYVNIMPQYRPCGTAYTIKELADYLSPEEYQTALQEAKEEGICRLDGRKERLKIFLSAKTQKNEKRLILNQ